MNGRVSEPQPRRPRAKPSKEYREALLQEVAVTGAGRQSSLRACSFRAQRDANSPDTELPRSHRTQSPLNGTYTRDAAAVPATKRKRDTSFDDPLPAKRVRLAQTDAQQSEVKGQEAAEVGQHSRSLVNR